jgi:hypothetical protein
MGEKESRGSDLRNFNGSPWPAKASKSGNRGKAASREISLRSIKAAPPPKPWQRPAPTLGVACAAGKVPPEIAAYDYAVASGIMMRLDHSYSSALNAPRPWEPKTRQAIGWLVAMCPRLMNWCHDLLDCVYMGFDTARGVERKDWRKVMERRNAALVAISTYADFPEVLEDFTTNKQCLGLRKNFRNDPKVQRIIRNEKLEDWKMSTAVGEALLSADLERAKSPYAVLRRASKNIQIDRVRELFRENKSVRVGGVKGAPGRLLSLEELQQSAAQLQAHFSEGSFDSLEDTLRCERLAETPAETVQAPHYTQESISKLMTAIAGDRELNAYVQAKQELGAPSALREYLGWGPGRVKRVRTRLLAVANQTLMRTPTN